MFQKKINIFHYLIPIFLISIQITTLPGCKKLPFVPDEGTIIYLGISDESIEPGESVTVFVRGEKESGYPLPDNTVVFITVSVGSIEGELSLLDGTAQVKYSPPSNYIGEIAITAHSGKATISPEQISLEVVEQDIEYLFIEADPYELPQDGGSSTITAYAKDKNMDPVAGKNLWLECDAGTLTNTGYFITDKYGKVRTTLHTDSQSIVEVKYKSLSESVTIKIREAKPPTSSFVYSPTNVSTGDTVYFNAEESDDEDGFIVSYKWNFGDGNTGSGKTISHVYNVSVDTTFYVTLKVKDNDGNETVSKQQIYVKI